MRAVMKLATYLVLMLLIDWVENWHWIINIAGMIMSVIKNGDSLQTSHQPELLAADKL